MKPTISNQEILNILGRYRGLRYGIRSFLYDEIKDYPQRFVNNPSATGYQSSTIGRKFVEANLGRVQNLQQSFLNYQESFTPDSGNRRLSQTIQAGFHYSLQKVAHFRSNNIKQQQEAQRVVNLYNLKIKSLGRNIPEFSKIVEKGSFEDRVFLINQIFLVGLFVPLTLQGIIAEVGLAKEVNRVMGYNCVKFASDEDDKTYGIDFSFKSRRGKELYIQLKSKLYKRDTEYGERDIQKNRDFENDKGYVGNILWILYDPKKISESGRMDLNSCSFFKYNDIEDGGSLIDLLRRLDRN